MNYAEKRARNQIACNKYKAAHPDRVKESGRRRYIRQKERLLALSRLWQSKNREKVRGYIRKYSQNNPEKVRALEILRCVRGRNKERSKKWRSLNPAKARQYGRNRQFAIKYGAVDCTDAISKLLIERYCHWCCREFSSACKLEIDHVHPLCRGGTHTPENLVASCEKCNKSKHKKLYWEWDGELAA